MILAHLKDAMAPGYSKLILNESVMPEMDCPAFFAAGDLNMMSILGGMKRSRSQWIELLTSAGFERVRVRTSPYSGDEEGVIEAVIAGGRNGAANKVLDEPTGKSGAMVYHKSSDDKQIESDTALEAVGSDALGNGQVTRNL